MDNVNIINVKSAIEFVGIKIQDNEINVFVPRAFRKNTDKKQLYKDVLLFLKTLSLAKTKKKEKMSYSSNFEQGDIWSIDSYIWIINDYIDNGFYYPMEKMYSNDCNGKINWRRTLQTTPLYSNGNLIYNDLVTTKMSTSNDIVTEIYKLCLAISLKRIGWVFNIKYKINVELTKTTKEMIHTLNKHLYKTFDDTKRLRFHHMLSILWSVTDDNINAKKYTYGINHYYYVFEKMIDSMFSNINSVEKKKYNPSTYWVIEKDSNKKEKAPLEPDTIHVFGNMSENRKVYIIDSKLYNFSDTELMKDIPGSQSIQKQITYADYVTNELQEKYVRNVFILPYNKEDNRFNYTDNIVYFGYASAEWRERKEDHDYIFGYFIDLMYLISNYKTNNDDIIKMYDNIENILLKGVKRLL